MSKVSLYIASSIDGYIASEEGSVDFLDSIDHEGEDYGFTEFYENIDAVAMGRKTYDFCLSVDQWPYAGKQSYVFTNSNLKTDRNDIKFLSGDVKEVSNKISDAGFKNIWLVGGGKLNAQFISHSLIDKIILTIIPVVLGKGIPLFGESDFDPVKYELTNVEKYSSGVVQLNYLSGSK